MAHTDEERVALVDDDLAIRREELALKRSEFDFRRQEAEYLKNTDKWRTLGSVGSVLVAAVALTIPVWVAAMNLRENRILSQEQARLTFQMKVADLAFADARNAKQVKDRAQSLAALFGRSELLTGDFVQRLQEFDPKEYKVDAGRSIENRKEMVTLLAQHPDQREQLLRDWYVLFEWEQWWVDPLLRASADEKKRLDELSERLLNNEEAVKAAD